MDTFIYGLVLGVLAVAGFVLGRRALARQQADPGAAPTLTPLERAREAIEELSPDERARLRHWFELRWPHR